MKVMLDIDGCLAGFLPSFSKVGHDMFGTRVVKNGNEQEKWDLIGGMTREQQDQVWEVVSKDPAFWCNMSIIVSGESVKLLKKLSKMKHHDFYYVTSRRGLNAKHQTKIWIHEHDLPRWDVIMAAKPSTKGLIAEGIGADVATEDSPMGIRSYKKHPLTYLIVPTYPYNADVSGPYIKVTGPDGMVNMLWSILS